MSEAGGEVDRAERRFPGLRRLARETRDAHRDGQSLIGEPEDLGDWFHGNVRRPLTRLICLILGHAYERHEPNAETRCCRCKLMR